MSFIIFTRSSQGAHIVTDNSCINPMFFDTITEAQEHIQNNMFDCSTSIAEIVF